MSSEVYVGLLGAQIENVYYLFDSTDAIQHYSLIFDLYKTLKLFDLKYSVMNK